MTVPNLPGLNSALKHNSSTKAGTSWPTDPLQQGSYLSSVSKFPHARFVYQQVYSQFNHDIWWLSLTILLITITESDHFKAEPLAFSTFRIIFETVSAYSCVGVSVGYPGQNYSFCGAWHAFSKLLLITVALRGRHRGLSVMIGNSTLFPGPWASSEKKDTVREGQV